MDLPEDILAVVKENRVCDIATLHSERGFSDEEIGKILVLAAKHGSLGIITHFGEWSCDVDKYALDVLAEAVDSCQLGILEHYVNLFGVDFENGFLLHRAALHRDCRVLTFLVEKGANVAQYGKQACMNACDANNSKGFVYLAEKGVKISGFGYAAFNCALNDKNNEMIELLARGGCRINANWNDLLTRAIDTKSLSAVKFLFKIRGNSSSFNASNSIVQAIMTGELDIVKYLAKKNRLCMQINPSPYLAAAIESKQQAVLEFVLKDVSLLVYSTYETAMKKAMRCENEPAVYSLIAHRDAPESPLSKALSIACELGNFNMAKRLVLRGADVRFNDSECLCRACSSGCLPLVQFLVEKGANVLSFCNEPIRTAMRTLNPDMVRYLMQHGAETPPRYCVTDFYHVFPDSRAYLDPLFYPNGQPQPQPQFQQSRPPPRDRPAKRTKTELERTRDEAINLITTQECPVCLNKFKDMERESVKFWPTCAHLICKPCETTLLASPRISACPVCRQRRE